MSVRHCVRTSNLLLFLAELSSALIDLSKLARLENVTFWVNTQTAHWVTMVLQTILQGHTDLRQVSIYLPSSGTLLRVGADIGRMLAMQWAGLDSLLIRIWKSRSIRPRIGYIKLRGPEPNGEYDFGSLLPLVKESGIADPI